MKKSRPLLLSRPMVIAGLVISFTLAAGTALFSSISTRNIANAGERVAETQETLLQINQLLASLIDAETGQRGYILTGLERYLDPYTRAVANLDEQLAALRIRLAHSAAQLATLDRVTTLIETKKADMQRTIELRREKSIGPALHVMDSGAGLASMNALREQVAELERREFSELALQSSSAGSRAHAFQLTALGVLVVCFGLAGYGVFLFMRRVNELESMITVCAWTRRVKYNGQWVSFEDYLHARFNLEFTHGISEEAAKKLQMEAIELVQTDPSSFKARPPEVDTPAGLPVRRSSTKPA